LSSAARRVGWMMADMALITVQQLIAVLLRLGLLREKPDRRRK